MEAIPARAEVETGKATPVARAGVRTGGATPVWRAEMKMEKETPAWRAEVIVGEKILVMVTPLLVLQVATHPQLEAEEKVATQPPLGMGRLGVQEVT